MRLILDSHLDIAWNALSFDRDQLQSIGNLRSAEAGMTGKGRGRCTVSLPEMRRTRVGACLGTILVRAIPEYLVNNDPTASAIAHRGHGPIILRENLDHSNQTIACAVAQGQLAYYRLLESSGHMRMIYSVEDLNAIWEMWERGDTDAPIGNILSMEGCDPIIEPNQAEWWWQQGLRTACLAHYGASAYAFGTGGDGPLTSRGRELLREFQRLGIILDLVHTADAAFWDALDIYDGPVFVSHGNCRALAPHDRQISDQQIGALVERNGILGVVLDIWMFGAGYDQQRPDNTNFPLTMLADHIDHICQLAGNANHVAIGSDLDGGFGTEETPPEIDTIADLHKLEPLLSKRGYDDVEIDNIFHGNWLRFFRHHLPKEADSGLPSRNFQPKV
ncbi:MAG: dipeptidase [Burkholderiaceae bacterium]